MAATQSAIEPRACTRRSPVYRRLEALGARFTEAAGAAVALSFGAEAAERDKAGRLGLCDLSPFPRTGFKGWASAAWLERQGLRVGSEHNRAYAQADGTLLARLSPGEVLVLSPVAGDFSTVRRLEAAWSMDAADGCYVVPRADSHAWFLVTGNEAAAMFAKICGVDLRPHRFADLAIAQTSVARLSAIVIRADVAGTPGYHLLADSASAEFLYDVLLDAMAEFGGGPVGLQALPAQR
jgi:sarcosine oxidase subunit gamma